MSLPPLPKPLVFGTRDTVPVLPIYGFNQHQMEDYGRACRAAALEECAQRFERVGGMIDPRSIAAAIRALKDAG